MAKKMREFIEHAKRVGAQPEQGKGTVGRFTYKFRQPGNDQSYWQVTGINQGEIYTFPGILPERVVRGILWDMLGYERDEHDKRERR
jgi:hypothetical protein